MARTFDGVDDTIQCSIGALTAQTTAGSFVAVCRRATDTDFDTIVGLHTSGGTNTLYFQINPSDQLILGSSGGEETSPFTVTSATGWCLLAVTKTSGTNVPRFHRYVYSTNTWTHQDASGAIDNGGTPGASGTFRTTWQTGDFFSGDIAAIGIWDTTLTDAQIEALAHSLVQWPMSMPKALWIFDQAATTQTVADITGNGANQSSLTGTAVATSSAPINYGLSTQLAPTLDPADYTFSDNFEDGDLATWSNVTAAVTNSTSAAKNGTRGMRQVNNGAQAVASLSDATLPDGYPWARVDCWFREVSHGSGNSSVITVQNRTGVDHFDFFINYDTDSKFWWDLLSSNNSKTPATVTLNQWYALTLVVNFGATTWTARVWIDGIEQTSIATSGKSVSDVRAIHFGGFGTDVNTRDFDDVFVRLSYTDPSPTALPQVVSDDAVLTDSYTVVMNYGRVVSDDSGLVDAQGNALNYARTYSDDTVLTDSATPALTSPRTFSDDAGSGDTLALSKSIAQPVSDDTALTDSVGMSVGAHPVFDDNAATTDVVSFAIGYGYPKTDDTGNVDDVTIARTRSTTQDDGAGSADALSFARTYGRTFNDNGGQSDEVTRLLSRGLDEDAGLGDASLSKTFYRPVGTDDTGLVDALALGVSKDLNEDVGLVDTKSVVVTFSRTRNDTAGTTDDLTMVAVFGVTSGEDAGLTDTLLKRFGLGLSEDVGLTDALALKVTKGLSDDAGLVDTFTRVVAYARTVSDNLETTDEVLIGLDFVRSVDDEAGLVDTVTLASTFPVAEADDVGLTDVLSVGIIYGLNVSDAMNVTDVFTTVEAFARLFSEQLPLYDDTSWAWGYNPSTGANSAGLADSVTLALTSTPTFSEDVGITDDVTVSVKREVQVSDVTGLADSVNLVATYRRTVSDDTDLTDGLATSHTIQLAINDHTGLVDTFLKATTFAILLGRLEENWKTGGVEENWNLEELYSEPG